MPTDNLPENIDATYADTGDASVKVHQQQHDRIHRIVNRSQVVVRWNAATKVWEETRPSWAPWGVVFDASNDAAAVFPPIAGLLVGDKIELHPASPLLPQNQ